MTPEQLQTFARLRRFDKTDYSAEASGTGAGRIPRFREPRGSESLCTDITEGEKSEGSPLRNEATLSVSGQLQGRRAEKPKRAHAMDS